MLALSFFHIGTFAVAAEDFNPLGRGVYLPQFDLLGNLRESGSQVCCNIWSEVIVCKITIKFAEHTACSSECMKYHEDMIDRCSYAHNFRSCEIKA